jgi:hypothetical protein
MTFELNKYFVFPSGVNSGAISVKYCDLNIQGSYGWAVYPTASNSSTLQAMDLTVDGGQTLITLAGASCVSSSVGITDFYTAGTTSTNINLISVNTDDNQTYTTSGTFTCNMLNQPYPRSKIIPYISGVYDSQITFKSTTLAAPGNNGIYIHILENGNETIVNFVDFASISNVFFSSNADSSTKVIAGSYQASSEITLTETMYNVDSSDIIIPETKATGIVANSTPELFVYAFNAPHKTITGIDLIPRDVRVTDNSIFIAGNPAASAGSNKATFYRVDNDLSSHTQGPVLDSTGVIYACAIEGGDTSGVYVAYNFTGTVTCATIPHINVTAVGSGGNTLLIKYNSDYKTVAGYYIHRFGDGTTFFTTSRIRVDPNGTGNVWLSGAMDSGTANMGSNKTITTNSNKSIWVAGFPTEKP